MAINGISGYGGFYNSYSVRDIPKVDVETVKQQDAAKELEAKALPKAPEKAEVASKPLSENRSRTADLDNISLNFNSGEDYSYIGSDFEIGGLDMEKAISDMQKDKVLMDYQYFVGSSDNLNEMFASGDGRVIAKF
ncbi:MAG: hypothetical protein K6E19_09935 [Lachnospiraceae bacterium]|nr:hypothetical protein [Lachnospiraceae bacterium]